MADAARMGENAASTESLSLTGVGAQLFIISLRYHEHNRSDLDNSGRPDTSREDELRKKNNEAR
jgi:hypothetical protein